MTIDEAIAMMHEWADYECYNEEQIQASEAFNQIAVLLEELKSLKQWKSDIMDEFCKYDASNFDELIAIARNKAIDDFVKKISLEISESIIWGMLVDIHKDNSFNDTSDKIVNYIIDTANEIAEQLKAGAKNEI